MPQTFSLANSLGRGNSGKIWRPQGEKGACAKMTNNRIDNGGTVESNFTENSA